MVAISHVLARYVLSSYVADRCLGIVLQVVPDMGTLDIVLRLSAATLVGVLLGLNRDLHGKSTGVRTLGVLCLGSALAVLSIHAVTGSDESRVIQGIVTGVGFLGAGVIVRSEKGHQCKDSPRPLASG